MYFVVMPNRNHSEHLGMFCIVMPSVFVNCPAVICLPNIASYLRETPLVICGPRSYLLHTVYKHLLQYSVYCFTASSTIFHTVLLILCFCKTGGIDNLSVSSWAKFWFVLCRFHVVEGTTVNWEPAILLAPGEESSPTTFRRSPSPTGSISLGRNSRENLLLSTS